ncbi:MAG: helix-turn-helix domain-containing protein [Paracoccaceae bacterium]
MSIALMSEVWRMDMPPTEKMVLLALADAANDDGITWLPVRSKRAGTQSLVKKCSLSLRAVQNAISQLVDGGHLSRRERPGKGVIYTVHPGRTCTPAADAPPVVDSPSSTDKSDVSNCNDDEITDGREKAGAQQVHPGRTCTPAADAGGGAADAPKPSINPQSPKDKLSERAGARQPQSEKKGKGKRADPATALPAGWVRPELDELPPEVRKMVGGWPTWAFDAIEAKFRAHHATSRRSDWPATWAKWLLSSLVEVQRWIAAGIRPQAESDAGERAADALEPAEIADDASPEAREIKMMLRDIMARRHGNDGSWRSWVAPCRFAIEGDELVLTAGSAFRADWLRNNLASAIEHAAGDLVVRVAA